MKALQVSDEDYKWFRDSIGEMRAMFADEGRSDWFDADDTAREIAEKLANIIEEAENGAV